jgi:hypothetical protein
MLLFILLGGAFIPLWILPSTPTALRAGVFWVQFGLQGASGVVPIWLLELSPPGFLAFFPGFVAQLGNVSSYLFVHFRDWPTSPLRYYLDAWIRIWGNRNPLGWS